LYAHADSDAHRYASFHTDSDPNTDCDPDAYSNANADANINTETQSDTEGSTDTCAAAMSYLPGLFSMFTAILLFRYAPAKRKVESLVVATGFGLCAMEWSEQTSHYISAATSHA
jgi:hypothetical protein